MLAHAIKRVAPREIGAAALLYLYTSLFAAASDKPPDYYIYLYIHTYICASSLYCRARLFFQYILRAADFQKPIQLAWCWGVSIIFQFVTLLGCDGDYKYGVQYRLRETLRTALWINDSVYIYIYMGSLIAFTFVLRRCLIKNRWHEREVCKSSPSIEMPMEMLSYYRECLAFALRYVLRLNRLYAAPGSLLLWTFCTILICKQ